MIATLVTLFHEGRELMEDTMEAISAGPRVREVYLGHRAISALATLFHEGRVLVEDTMEVISADPRAREVYLGYRA